MGAGCSRKLPVIPQQQGPQHEANSGDAADICARLCRAAKHGDASEIARILGAGGASDDDRAPAPRAPASVAVNARGMWGSTPLIYACQYGQAAAARALLRRGADPCLRNARGASALLFACVESGGSGGGGRGGGGGNGEGGNVSEGSKAVQGDGMVGVVRALLRHGAAAEVPPALVYDPQRDRTAPLTPLAAVAGRTISSSGGAPRDGQRDATQAAAAPPLLAELLAAGARPSAVFALRADAGDAGEAGKAGSAGRSGCATFSALDAACEARSYGAIGVLLDALNAESGDTEPAAAEGQTPPSGPPPQLPWGAPLLRLSLSLALAQDQAEGPAAPAAAAQRLRGVVERLVAAGAAVDAADERGRTALHWAAVACARCKAGCSRAAQHSAAAAAAGEGGATREAVGGGGGGGGGEGGREGEGEGEGGGAFESTPECAVLVGALLAAGAGPLVADASGASALRVLCDTAARGPRVRPTVPAPLPPAALAARALTRAIRRSPRETPCAPAWSADAQRDLLELARRRRLWAVLTVLEQEGVGNPAGPD